MAITSIGYEGTVSELNWAKLTAFLGCPHCVAGTTDYGLTLVTGVDRTVRIAAGQAYGDGVLDTNDANVDLQLPVVGSGVRWDTIALRRDWQPVPGTSTLVSIQGTSTKQVTLINQNPGVIADQPLWLAQVTFGQTQVTATVDLRGKPSRLVTFPTADALLPTAPRGRIALYKKQLWYRPDTGDGWKTVHPRIEHGTFSVLTNASGIATVTFPGGGFDFTPTTFNVWPRLLTIPVFTAPDAAAGALTATGGRFRAFKLDNSPYVGGLNGYWIAMGG